jgi:hypothetical protein
MNVTVFSRYHDLEALSPLADLDRRCLNLTRQLYGDTDGVFMRDYEQLLRKLPGRPTAQFPPHQGVYVQLCPPQLRRLGLSLVFSAASFADMHYWPKAGKESGRVFDTRTATCSIAVNAATRKNGCLWVLPGSHAAQDLYPGCLSKAADSRAVAGGVIKLEVLPEDVSKREFLPLSAGDLSVRSVSSCVSIDTAVIVSPPATTSFDRRFTKSGSCTAPRETQTQLLRATR